MISKFEMPATIQLITITFAGVFMAKSGIAVISCIVLNMFHSCLRVPLRRKLRAKLKVNCPTKRDSAEEAVYTKLSSSSKGRNKFKLFKYYLPQSLTCFGTSYNSSQNRSEQSVLYSLRLLLEEVSPSVKKLFKSRTQT